MRSPVNHYSSTPHLQAPYWRASQQPFFKKSGRERISCWGNWVSIKVVLSCLTMKTSLQPMESADDGRWKQKSSALWAWIPTTNTEVNHCLWTARFVTNNSVTQSETPPSNSIVMTDVAAGGGKYVNASYLQSPNRLILGMNFQTPMLQRRT